MHFTMLHTTSLLCVSYLDHLSQIVTNIREIPWSSSEEPGGKRLTLLSISNNVHLGTLS